MTDPESTDPQSPPIIKPMRHSLMNDIVFKIVFGSKQNKVPLCALLNAVLGLTGQDRIKDVVISNPYGHKKRRNDKGIILDIKASDGLGRHYNVEVQVSREPKYIERSLYYLSSLYSEQILGGEPYSDLKRTVGISILAYDLFPGRKDLHSTYRFYDVAHAHELSDVLEIHYLELSKFDQDKLHGERTPLEKWLHILKFGDIYERGLEPLPEQLIREEGIVMALDAMKRAYADSEVRERIEARLKAQSIEATRRVVYEEAERRAQEAEQKAEEAERKADETQRKAEETQRKAEETQRKAEETQRKAEETQRKAEETQRKAEETQRKAEETQRKAEETQRKAEETQRKAEARLAELEREIRRLSGQ